VASGSTLTLAGPQSRHFPWLQTHSSLRPLQLHPHHPQIGQGKQGDQLCSVLLEATVAVFDLAKLALDYPKRMLHLGSIPGLGFFNLVYQLIKRIALVQGPAFAWAHGSVPCHAVFGIWAVVDALITRIAIRIHFLPVQQAVAFEHIVNIARCAPHGVQQAKIGVCANVCLHAKVPLVVLLAGVHFRVAGFIVVLGGTGSCYERGVHHGAGLEQQTALDQQVIDGGQDLFGQLMFFQPMTEPQDGALVGHARELWELGKFPVQRHIKERVFHARVRQGEPLLQKVRAQHGRQREGGTPLLAFGAVRRDQIDQRLPWDNFVHLFQELALAGFIHAQAQIKANLFHGSMMLDGAYVRHTGVRLLQSFLRSICLGMSRPLRWWLLRGFGLRMFLCKLPPATLLPYK
jgi:hypothetical protein